MLNFTAGTDADGNNHEWDDDDAPDWTEWHNQLKNHLNLNEKFFLQSTDEASEFRNVCLFFFPVVVSRNRWWIEAFNEKWDEEVDNGRDPNDAGDYNFLLNESTNHADAEAAAKFNAASPLAHYNVEVKLRLDNAVTSPRPAGTTSLEVGNQASPLWVARYIYGSNPAGAAATGGTAFTAADLNWIRDWVRTQLGDNSFVIKNRIDF
jgi:hypothetical protein